MRTLAVLTNGGDTCSLNAVIKAVRDNAIAAGYPRVLGFEGGFLGILNKWVKLLTWEHIDPQQGGTILRSLRYAPRSEPEKEEVFRILRDLEVDALVVIGGDGSLRAARELYDYASSKGHGIRILGFPRTIDNDIRTNTFKGSTEVALCPGYPSAALKIARLTRDLRTTAMSTNRIFTIETMGREAGWLAAAASLGGAELVLMHEAEPKTEDDWGRFFERVARLYEVHRSVIIAVSEGLRLEGEQVKLADLGGRKLGGVGAKVADMLIEAFKPRDVQARLLRALWPITEEEIDAYLNLNPDAYKERVRYQHGDYIPRMGSPSGYDIELAYALGRELRAMLDDGSDGELPVPVRVPRMEEMEADDISRIPLSRVEKFLFPAAEFYSPEEFNVTDSFIDFLKKFVDPGEL